MPFVKLRAHGGRLHALLALGAVAAVAVSAAAQAGAPAHRHGPSGVTIDPLAQATIRDRVHVDHAGIKIKTRGPRDLLTAAITVDPGGSFGWHTHPGPVVVAVAAGTLSLFEVEGRRCVHRRVRAGAAFVEDGGHLHLARNDGSAPVRIYATFFARAGTTEFLTARPDPGVCRS
jgi:quercetin dioxygenase-like cupin family protein